VQLAAAEKQRKANSCKKQSVETCFDTEDENKLVSPLPHLDNAHVYAYRASIRSRNDATIESQDSDLSRRLLHGKTSVRGRKRKVRITNHQRSRF